MQRADQRLSAPLHILIAVVDWEEQPSRSAVLNPAEIAKAFNCPCFEALRDDAETILQGT